MKVGDVVIINEFVRKFCVNDKTVFEVIAVPGDANYDEKNFNSVGFMIGVEVGDFPYSDGEEDGWFWLAEDHIEGVIDEEV